MFLHIVTRNDDAFVPAQRPLIRRYALFFHSDKDETTIGMPHIYVRVTGSLDEYSRIVRSNKGKFW